MAATVIIEDTTQVESFGDRVFGDFIGAITIVIAALGDRLGLFKALYAHGPLTSEGLASVAGVDERYAREWLNGMACAGYIETEPGTGRFVLPEGHVPALAEEGGAEFLGGSLQEIPAVVGTFEHLVHAFRHGGGVRQADYHPGFWEGMQRETAGIYNNMLVQEWIPAVPEVERRLEAGTNLADIGCGSGLALIRLAQAFPASRFTGIDNFPAQADRAVANIAQAGLDDRIQVRIGDPADGLGEQAYGVITSFDVVHDAARPLALMRGLREALEPGGIYLMAEPNAGETLEENLGPIGTYLYGASLLYCMTTSLAEGGAGLGTAGLPESTVRSLATEAGFSSVERIGIAHPLYALYALRA